MAATPHLQVRGLRVAYGRREVLHGVSFEVRCGEIFAVIGPAQPEKTSLLRCLNRTLDFIPGATASGEVFFEGENVLALRDVPWLRRRIGMVSPLPLGLPISIYDNVAFASRCAGIRDRGRLDAIVEQCLRQAALWDEVRDRLSMLGTHLSGGQQQRVTIARALSHQPDILCLAEFSIAIDPVTTMRIEDMLRTLRDSVTVILVTHLNQQARRLADRTMFLGDTDLLFSGHVDDRRPEALLEGDSDEPRGGATHRH